MGLGLSSPEQGWGGSAEFARFCKFRTKSGLSGGFQGGQRSLCSAPVNGSCKSSAATSPLAAGSGVRGKDEGIKFMHFLKFYVYKIKANLLRKSIKQKSLYLIMHKSD